VGKVADLVAVAAELWIFLDVNLELVVVEEVVFYRALAVVVVVVLQSAVMVERQMLLGSRLELALTVE
jgi:hypothetical protein